MEASIPIQTLVKLVDAEDLTKQKYLTPDFPMETNEMTSKLLSQNLLSEVNDWNLDIFCTQKK